MDMDVHETKDELVIKADQPGMVKDDLHITLEEGTLRIGAEKKEEKTEDGMTWYTRERHFGQVFTPDRAALPRSGREDLGHPRQASTRDQVAQGRGNQTEANRSRSAVGAVTKQRSPVNPDSRATVRKLTYRTPMSYSFFGQGVNPTGLATQSEKGWRSEYYRAYLRPGIVSLRQTHERWSRETEWIKSLPV